MELEEEEKVKILTWLIADGQELDSVEHFDHFHSYGTVLKDDNNLVTKAVNKISAKETQLHDRLIIEILQNNMEKERLHFLILQSQHMLAIRGI